MNGWFVGEFKRLEMNCLLFHLWEQTDWSHNWTGSLVFGSPVRNLNYLCFIGDVQYFPLAREDDVCICILRYVLDYVRMLADAHGYAAGATRGCTLLSPQSHHWFVSSLWFALFCDMQGKSFSYNSCTVLFASHKVSGRTISIHISSGNSHVPHLPLVTTNDDINDDDNGLLSVSRTGKPMTT